MKAGVGLGRLEAALHQDRRVIEIDRGVIATLRAVVVDDPDSGAGWTREQGLVLNVNLEGAQRTAAPHRVKGKDLQRPAERGADWRGGHVWISFKGSCRPR